MTIQFCHCKCFILYYSQYSIYERGICLFCNWKNSVKGFAYHRQWSQDLNPGLPTPVSLWLKTSLSSAGLLTLALLTLGTDSLRVVLCIVDVSITWDSTHKKPVAPPRLATTKTTWDYQMSS
jgi:hypothetical protein